MDKGKMSESKKAKGGRMWKKVKYELVEYNSLPAYLKDNEYILRHYRSEWPLKHLLLSIFTIHNETLNVWTHLVGFFLFVALTIHTATNMPADIQQNSDMVQRIQSFSSNMSTCPVQDSAANCSLSGGGGGITRWPVYAYLGGAMLCLLSSSACHLVACHSKRVWGIMVRVDYGGIAVLIAMSFYPPVYYTFMCHPSPRSLYLWAISLLGVATLFYQPVRRTLRAALFFAMGVSGVAPILHKLLLFGPLHPAALLTTSLELLMGFLYSLGALVYATRVPERWLPGRFDLAGHSHQLFHLLVLAAALTHYRSSLLYLQWRHSEGCPPPDSCFWNNGLIH